MTRFTPPVAIASLSGESDAAWARRVADLVGAAFLGGVALDAPTRAAARGAVARGRDEFLPEDPVAFIDDQLDRLEGVDVHPAVNVRAREPSAVARAAAVCADHGAILEVNAHCRQPECTARGCGQALLTRPDALGAQVSAAADAGAPVSVKVRTEVPGVDLPGLSAELVAAGADVIHVDAMDSRPVVGDVVRAVDATVIANNNVRSAADVHEYLALGADAVSVGRPSDDRGVLGAVVAATRAADHPS